MKTLNIPLEDQEYEDLNKVKELSGKNWHDFILTLRDGTEAGPDGGS